MHPHWKCLYSKHIGHNWAPILTPMLLKCANRFKWAIQVQKGHKKFLLDIMNASTVEMFIFQAYWS